MKLADKQQAIEIISKQNNVKMSLNVPVNDNYSNCHDILIHSSNATTINELIKAGFSLAMCEK